MVTSMNVDKLISEDCFDMAVYASAVYSLKTIAWRLTLFDRDDVRI